MNRSVRQERSAAARCCVYILSILKLCKCYMLNFKIGSASNNLKMSCFTVIQSAKTWNWNLICSVQVNFLNCSHNKNSNSNSKLFHLHTSQKKTFNYVCYQQISIYLCFPCAYRQVVWHGWVFRLNLTTIPISKR